MSSPAAIGRAHALHRLAELASDRADEVDRAHATAARDEDRAYLRAYALTCRGVADRLRASPGYAYAAQMLAVAEFADRKGRA